MGNFLAVGVPRLNRMLRRRPALCLCGPPGAEFVPSGAGEATLLGLFSGELLRLQTLRRSGGPCLCGSLSLSLSLPPSLPRLYADFIFIHIYIYIDNYIYSKKPQIENSGLPGQ